MKKRAVYLLGAVVLLAAALLVPRLMKSREDKITDFVLSHQQELTAIALDCLAGREVPKEYKGVEVDGAYGDMAQFYHSGTGLVPSSTYYGFYYSADGAPKAFQNVKAPLTQVSDTEWTWTDGTDNGGVTKKITENWFYYMAWF